MNIIKYLVVWYINTTYNAIHHWYSGQERLCSVYKRRGSIDCRTFMLSSHNILLMAQVICVCWSWPGLAVLAVGSVHGVLRRRLCGGSSVRATL